MRRSGLPVLGMTSVILNNTMLALVSAAKIILAELLPALALVKTLGTGDQNRNVSDPQ